MKQQKDNSGAAFPRNSDNPKAPFASGPLRVDGKDWEISIWKDKSQKDGSPYFSIKVKEPWQKGQRSNDVDEAF